MKLLLIPFLYLLVVWGALFFALHKTRHLRVPQRKSKYSPFSRKMTYTVSLVHLANDRMMWVKARLKDSQSPARFSAQTAVNAAEPKLELAKGFLANDELKAANKLLYEVLALLTEAEDKLDQRSL